MPMFDPEAWDYIGEVTASSAVRTGVLSWEKPYELLHFEYFIAGYSGSAIGRLIVGPAAGLSETATDHCATHLTNVTVTTSVSIPGWPTFGGTADNVARWGNVWVKNIAAEVKRMTATGINAGTAATTAPTTYQMGGLMSNATASIQRAELAVYAAITGATISATTFSAGTYLKAWGSNQ
jgi:hypothetical protein